VTKILHESYPGYYFHLSRDLGVLNAISLDYYYCKVVLYEDKKIAENGYIKEKPSNKEG
jgi:hypothetical protein